MVAIFRLGIKAVGDYFLTKKFIGIYYFIVKKLLDSDHPSLEVVALQPNHCFATAISVFDKVEPLEPLNLSTTRGGGLNLLINLTA